MARRTGTIIVIVLIIAILSALFIFLGDYIGGEVITNPVTTKQLRSTFSAQSALLSQPIAALGITGHPAQTVQCVVGHSTRLDTYYSCFDLYTYPYKINPISDAARKTFPAKAAALDALLKQNGWVNDQPHDAVTTIADSNPYLPQNGGNGYEVPFHKNMGSITCNLEISFQSLFQEIDEGSINVDVFSCQTTVKVFIPHFSQAQLTT